MRERRRERVRRGDARRVHRAGLPKWLPGEAANRRLWAQRELALQRWLGF